MKMISFSYYSCHFRIEFEKKICEIILTPLHSKVEKLLYCLTEIEKETQEEILSSLDSKVEKVLFEIFVLYIRIRRFIKSIHKFISLFFYIYRYIV